MKVIIYILAIFLSFNSFSQNERAIDLVGSTYVVVKYQDVSKNGSGLSGIKFINAEVGKVVKVEFDDKTSIKALKQVKIDSLDIDEVLVITGKVDKKNTNWFFESKVQLYSHDGKLKNMVSLDQQINDFVINQKAGKIILILSPNNFKSNSPAFEQSEVIYDLKTLKRL